MIRADSELLLASFAASERALLLGHTRVACWLSLLLVPAGITLDYFVYPEFFTTFLYARIACDLAILPILFLLYTRFVPRSIRWVSAWWAVTPMWMICWMIYRSEGTVSTYYAGLSLMVIATCQLLPYKFLDALLYSLIVIGSYALACVMNANHEFDFSVFYNNVYFLLLTCIVCVTTSLFFERRRRQEFRLRYELDLSNQKLAEIDQLKSKFFANISHELRTPLTLVLSPVENLLQSQRELPESIRETLEDVRQNSLRLLRLINDLLDIVRLEEGKQFVDLKTIDLVMLLTALNDSVRQLAARKKIQLKSSRDRQPLLVEGDSARLEKVFLNLLTNAVKFTPEGGEITVAWHQSPTNAIVTITDTGVGIDQQHVVQIFQRFGQVDASITRQHQGLGIGLALAKDLVSEHQGTLEVSSEIGKGSTFTVTLPLSKSGSVDVVDESSDPLLQMYQSATRSVLTSSDSHIADDPHGTGHVARVGGDLENATNFDSSNSAAVLVIDDEDDIRRFLLKILAAEHAVEGASRGPAGIELARQRSPKVVVVDQMMPEMSGLEVASELRSDPRTRSGKILMLTAKIDEKSKLDALRAGVDDFMTKPFNSMEFVSRVNNLVRTYDLEASLRNANQELSSTLSKLQATEAQLVQSEKINAIGSLAAGLLHEINNPLNFTLMAVETLSNTSDSEDEDLQDTLSDISGGMKRISTIVSDLRAFAYPEQAELKTEFCATGVVESAVRFTSHETRDCTIETDLEAGCRAIASHTHVSHVLINLIVNARNAIEKMETDQQPLIRITARRNENRVVFSVEDNGCGIKEEIRNRIFEPFFTTGELGKGMGLGLSICHTIVKNHGGVFRVETEVGKGSVFQFDVPSASTEITDESGF